RILDHLRRPIPGRRDLLTNKAGPTVNETVPRAPIGRSVRLVVGLEVWELPRSVEGRRIGSVDAEVDEPTGAGFGLDPAGVALGRGFGTESQRDGFVGRDVGEFEHGPQSGQVLVSGDLAARLGVV